MKLQSQNERIFVQLFERRPNICGFSLKFVWQDGSWINQSTGITYEISFQFLWWMTEIMYYSPRKRS